MDYQGNSRKEREQQEKKEQPEKNIEKVIVGEVVRRPKTIGRKFKDIFLGGDAKQTARFITGDVLLPALRNLIVDMTSKGIERIVYGETRRRPSYQRTDYNTRYHLSSPLAQRPMPMDPRDRAYLPDQPRIRQNRYEMADIILVSREEAELVLERLNDILETYQVVALADLNALLGLETSHIDNKWGWTYLTNARISQVRQGFLLELPLPEEI